MAKNKAPAQTFAPTVYALPPQLPADPGLAGKYTQQAFNMAGPRVGFVQPPPGAGYTTTMGVPATARPFDPLDPNFNPTFPRAENNPFLGAAPQQPQNLGGFGSFLSNVFARNPRAAGFSSGGGSAGRGGMIQSRLY